MQLHTMSRTGQSIRPAFLRPVPETLAELLKLYPNGCNISNGGIIHNWNSGFHTSEEKYNKILQDGAYISAFSQPASLVLSDGSVCNTPTWHPVDRCDRVYYKNHR